MSRIGGNEPIATMPTYPHRSSQSQREPHLRSLAAFRPSNSNVGQNDKMVAEHMLLTLAGREMPGQMLAHSTNCAHKTVGCAAPANCVREIGHDRLPCPCRHLLVDGSIGNNLGEAFADRDIDQYPRAADRGVEVLRQELLHGALVHPGAL